MILKPQEFGDGNVPEKTGKGEGQGTQGHSFNQKSLSLPHGSKNSGKRLVLEILHGCYLKIISSASAQNSGRAISNLE